MNLTQFEIMVSLAEEKKFTEAAEAIGITQAAASHALSKMEDELGVKLFERHRSGAVVTEVGTIVLDHAREILAHVESIRQAAISARNLGTSKLRIGVVPTAPSRLLTGIVGDFQRRYPDTDIALFEGDERDLRAWLETQVIDVALVSSLSPHTGDNHRTLAQTTLKVVLSADHHLGTQSSISIDQLQDEALIILKTGSERFQSEIATAGHTPLQVRYEISNANTILSMIRDGLGVSIMPEVVIGEQRDGLQIMDLTPSFALYIGLMAFPGDTPLQFVRMFMTNAQQWAKQHGFLSLD
ncbi:MAG: LysR family transcriptional regulator [Chloroflexota bacterium]